MEQIFKKLFLSFSQVIPAVRAEEEEITDPQTIIRSQCQKKECAKYYELLETCNTRVTSRKKTSETCDEEMIDFVNCLDHCASKTLFTKLK